MLVQEFRALEAGWQLLRDRARLDPRAGEPDERVRLGKVDVAEDRVRGEHATGRGVGQDRDERDALGPKAFQGTDRLGQLHEGERALLHPGAARCRHDDERHPQLERRLGRPGDLLADDRAHRAAHEREVHDADRHRSVVDRPRPHTAASRMPVAACAAATRSGYGFWSTNPSGSTDWSPASRSSNVPGSRSIANRAAADRRK